VQLLSKDWNDLLRSSAADTIFLTWEWINAWWESYSGGMQPYVLAIREGDELIGVAPFCRHRVHRWGKTWDCLRFIGDGSHDSDYLDCFVRYGLESEAMKAVASFLGRQLGDWDWLDLHGPHEESPTLAAMQNWGLEIGWRSSRERIPCTTLPFPRDWETLLHGLQPRFRTKARSCLSFFEERVSTIPEECTSQRDMETWLEELFELHSRRWQTRTLPGVFQDPARREFYRRISKSTLNRGWLAFHRLRWGERPLALQYGFRYRNCFFLLQEGFDPDFEGLRPGLALRSWLMRHWLESGLAAYDFLAGASPYKLEWGAQTRHCVRLRLAPPGTATWVAFQQDELAQELKGRVKLWLPQAALALRRDWQASQAARRRQRTNESMGEASRDGLVRRFSQRLYLDTPVGTGGRFLAERFEVTPSRHWPFRFSLTRRRSSVLHILMFHRVNDDHDPFFAGALSRTAFRAQMEYVAKHFPVVSLEEFSQKGLPENGHKYYVAVTFDDGYRDNFLHAFPVLRELCLPATIFLTTGYIESGELPWYDQVCLAFKLSTRRRLSLVELGGPQSSLANHQERIEALNRTLAWLRRLTEESRAEALAALFHSLRVVSPLTLPNVMLRWNDIRQMAKNSIDFGAHTITHPVLARLPLERLKEEIGGSKCIIEGKLQMPVHHFSYPFGRPFDIGDRAPEIVQKSGFATAVTTVWGCNRQGDDPYSLKRFTPWGSDLGAFAIQLDRFRMVDSLQRTSGKWPLNEEVQSNAE
jgi:CelD/BcsL family acetyltransferase involved in cellulose biosynthesis/peptidoglycan/xylan/chitin deacetylase (PgdA/CDA1 family)